MWAIDTLILGGSLHRFFSTFPRGQPGLGLLLLRAAIGVTAILHGVTALSGNLHQSAAAWVPALLSTVSGVSLLAGFLTPIGGVMILFGAMGTAFTDHVESRPLSMLIAVLAAAVILLGPGAWSFDARLFGRREIIIHRASHLPRS